MNPELAVSEVTELDSLVHKACAGNASALSRILLAARDDAEPTIARKIRESPRLRAILTADDILQDACFFAIRDLGRGLFTPEPGAAAYTSFVKWFSTIARHRLSDKLDEMNASKRGGGRQRVPWQRDDGATCTSLPDAIVVHLATPSKDMKRNELVAAVRQGLDRIRPIYRGVLELKMVFGLSHSEIAAELNKEVATVRKLLSRAIKALAREVGDYSRYITRV
jgi:RNA polymerase sigma factor (sigma-70 family)